MNNDFEYHNVVDVFVFNHNGQIALQKRSFDDKSFPGHWDFSAGGHIDLRLLTRCQKEVFEEIGLKATPFVSKSLK
jgi:isopentenyldiphosphate isomerase